MAERLCLHPQHRYRDDDDLHHQETQAGAGGCGLQLYRLPEEAEEKLLCEQVLG